VVVVIDTETAVTTRGTKRRLRVVSELPGPKSQALRLRESKWLAPGSQAIAAYAGIAIETGWGAEFSDVDGNCFLDFAAGICVAALGYAHPRYVSELTTQLRQIHVGSFTSRARVEALESIASVLPAGLDRVQFYSGGSEAVESAIRLARAKTQKTEILSFWGGFHGKTAGSLAQMGSAFKHGLGPLAPGAYLAPYADCSRCPFKLKYESCALLCAEFVSDKLELETSGNLAAILVEPMQGTAGNVVPPPDWLPAIAQIAKNKGALLIADEMITGFGRTGRYFGVEHTGVAPDIMTVGKSLGAGYPVSAVITRHEIAQCEPWSKPSFSSSSYGGNPLAAAAVAASVGIIRDEGLVERAKTVGSALKSGLEALSDRFACVTSVRGEGLFVGFDLVDPRTGLPWSASQCQQLFQALLRRGLMTMAYAPRVRVNPPLVTTEAQVDEGLAIMHEALAEVTSG
jgi:4-aminobutyrate aminotransferase / (S)-3-amino-2-methylpropionate transaminase / 5-aminovalerate transaminase